MALDFPSSPIDGQLFTDIASGARFIYNSVPGVWDKISTGNVGFQGSIGAAGPGYQGSQGFLGSYGFQGSIGSSGFQGSFGFQGSIGSSGFQGSFGITGYQGSQTQYDYGLTFAYNTRMF